MSRVVTTFLQVNPIGISVSPMSMCPLVCQCIRKKDRSIGATLGTTQGNFNSYIYTLPGGTSWGPSVDRSTCQCSEHTYCEYCWSHSEIIPV